MQGILDNDLYKFTMQQAVCKLYPNALGIFQFSSQAGKESHRGDPQVGQRAAGFDQGIDCMPHHPGHGLDLLRLPGSIPHEKRCNEVVDAHNRLRDQPAQGGALAEPTRPAKELWFELGCHLQKKTTYQHHMDPASR